MTGITALPNDDGTVTVVTPLGVIDYTRQEVKDSAHLTSSERHFLLPLFEDATPFPDHGTCTTRHSQKGFTR
jgi:hypothetical protein